MQHTLLLNSVNFFTAKIKVIALNMTFIKPKESTQDRNSRKRFNYLYSYSRSFLILI